MATFLLSYSLNDYLFLSSHTNSIQNLLSPSFPFIYIITNQYILPSFINIFGIYYILINFSIMRFVFRILQSSITDKLSYSLYPLIFVISLSYVSPPIMEAPYLYAKANDIFPLLNWSIKLQLFNCMQ